MKTYVHKQCAHTHIHGGQDVEAAQTSISWSLANPAAVHPHCGEFVDMERDGALNCPIKSNHLEGLRRRDDGCYFFKKKKKNSNFQDFH